MSQIELTPKHLRYYKVGTKITSGIGLSDISSPTLFLRFARSDIKRKYRRNRTNALSNAKRALHYQVDFLGKVLGIKKLPKKHRKDFPTKLTFLSRCGVITPKILNKLNKLRNIMEHEYLIPDFDETSDFIDVVELFVSATENLLRLFPGQVHFRLKSKSTTKDKLPLNFAIEMEHFTGELKFFVSSGKTEDREDEFEFIMITRHQKKSCPSPDWIINVSDGETYFNWVDYLLNRAYPQ